MKKQQEHNLVVWFSACMIFASLCFVSLQGCKPAPEPAYTLQLERIAAGLEHPTSLVAAPDNSSRFFVTEQRGLIKIIEPDGSIAEEPFLDVRNRMVQPSAAYDESGLLGLVFHPQYAENGRFFIYYNAVPGPETPLGYHSDVRLSE